MPTYKGFNERTEKGGFLVTKDGEVLSPTRSQKVWNHSPDGFGWGYGGSSPAQLALAILLEETDEATAMRLHQRFKWQVIAALNQNEGWELTSERIQKWLEVAKVTKGNFL
jgi:hypothetical protein